MWTGGSLVKISSEIGLKRKNYNGYVGKMIPNKSVKHSTINNRKCISLSKYEINHDDRNSNDDSISHDDTISHDVYTCFRKKDFNYYQVKYIKKLQNGQDVFLKKLFHIERIERKKS